jgi:hypothetical protein
VGESAVEDVPAVAAGVAGPEPVFGRGPGPEAALSRGRAARSPRHTRGRPSLPVAARPPSLARGKGFERLRRGGPRGPLAVAARASRAGVTLAEVVVVVFLAAIIGLIVLWSLPRQREAARSVRCRRNLAQIGEALFLYDQAQGHLPTTLQTGPLEALRAGLGLDEFVGLDHTRPNPRPAAGPPPAPHRIAGFLCPSDRQAIASAFPAPASYRANAGSGPDGRDGPFGLDSVVSLARIESGRGLSHTAAFAERLVGDGRDGVVSKAGYALVKGPITESCPPTPPAAWRGDAGSNWSRPGWISSLYNHAMTPNAQPSCIADDGRTARMGASSAHVEGVHLLRFDLSVAPITPRIDPEVWKRLGRIPVAGGPSAIPHEP